MIRFLAILSMFLFVFTMGCRTQSRSATEPPPSLESLLAKPPSPYWRMVASSDLIIRTRMEFPGKPLTSSDPRDDKKFSEVELPVLDVLKEEPGLSLGHSLTKLGRGNWKGRVVRLRIYVGKEIWDPANDSPGSLCRQFRGKEAIVFLWALTPAAGGGRGFTLTETKNFRGIQACSDDLANQIRGEVSHQSRAIDLVRDYLGTHTIPLEARVNQTVAKLMDKQALENPERDKIIEEIYQGKRPRGTFRMTSPVPLAELEELGMDAVPAILKVLDDRRKLPGGGISIALDIHDHPHAWEGIYHTGASQVVQVLDMALGQITLDGIPGPFPGREYQDRAVGFWRIWFIDSGMLAGIKAGKLPSESVPKPKRLEPNTSELPAVHGSVGIL